MSKTHIRFSPDILRRLGEELNPTPDRGILELVKNAYDADARKCTVELIDTEEPGGTVRVSDNGDGMDADAIERGWVVVGRSDKSPRQRTRLDRIPVGSKGLGRLAALRMGSKAQLTTRPRDERNIEYSLLIDWDEFDKVDFVEDVALTIEKTPRSPGTKQGTEVEVVSLRTKVTRMEAKRLARELILLADPFGDDPAAFTPILRTPEFSDLEALVKRRYFDDAEYHLTARLDAEGRAQASVLDWRGEELFSCGHETLAVRRQKAPYACPPATFDLWVYILNSKTFSTRRSTLKEVRTWLGQFSGVHLYQNGLRVAPYGNPGNDWLDINLRRTQSPEVRPSTGTAIGRVMVENVDDVLVQKTDRSGFIEGDAFLEMRSFAQDAMEWMAKRRLEVAERRRAIERAAAPAKTRKSKETLDKAIAGADVPEAAQAEIIEAVTAYDRSRDREVDQLRKEVQLYRTLSTAGITAATFAHESAGNPIKIIKQSIQTVRRRAQRKLGSEYDNLLRQPVDGVIQAIEGLAVLGDATLKLVEHEKRRPSRVDIHGVIDDILQTFKPFLTGRDVAIDLQLCNGSPYLHASQAAIESIVTNLLNNSMAAFERTTVPQRTVRICTSVDNDTVTLHVMDNGPGIEGISKRDIWLPGHTTRRNGTGLGLTIVRDTVSDLSGEVDVVEHGELGGAEMIVRLPILGV